MGVKISVCLASYNGERYIEAQIASILEQLPADGELIVSDDASTDGTVALVRSFDDPRIRLFAHEDNVFYVRNFERALAAATGDILFLSDQDDEWMPDKIDTVLAAFAANPDAGLVVHGFLRIDVDGATLPHQDPLWKPSEAGRRPRAAFLIRQILKGQIFGCSAAFRRSLLDILLPFPALTYAHDHWLAVAAPAAGPVVLMNERLVRYRHHDSNLSPRSSIAFVEQLKARARLAVLAATALARVAARR